MIVYTYILFKEKLDPLVFKNLLDTVPEGIRKQVLRYRNDEDRYNCLFGKLLLREILVDYFGQSVDCLDRLYTNKYGKLYLDGDVYFNISHSSELVVCAISGDSEIGVDVEKKQAFDVNDIECFLRPEEMKMFQNDPSPSAFYDFWTKKESLLKAKGVGLSANLQDVYINEEEGYYQDPEKEKWFYKTLEVHEDYLATICSRKMNMDVKLVVLDRFKKEKLA